MFRKGGDARSHRGKTAIILRLGFLANGEKWNRGTDLLHLQSPDDFAPSSPAPASITAAGPQTRSVTHAQLSHFKVESIPPVGFDGCAAYGHASLFAAKALLIRQVVPRASIIWKIGSPNSKNLAEVPDDVGMRRVTTGARMATAQKAKLTRRMLLTDLVFICSLVRGRVGQPLWNLCLTSRTVG